MRALDPPTAPGPIGSPAHAALLGSDSHFVWFTCSRTEPKRSHQLRYVLRNKETDEVYLVLFFTIYLKDDVNEDGTIKEGADRRAAQVASGHEASDDKPDDDHDEEKALKEAKEKLGPTHGEETETSADDVD